MRSPAYQRFKNGEIHQWYRLVLGFSDHLVSGLLDEFGLTYRNTVLDPFCGSGTTLVECMKRGIHAWGLDANPSSHFAACVKTTWSLQPERLPIFINRVVRNFDRWRQRQDLPNDPAYQYCYKAGMIERGWISQEALLDAIALKRAICRLQAPEKYKNALLLLATNELVHSVSNVKFGPELYCSKTKQTKGMIEAFEDRASIIAEDLSAARGIVRGCANVFLHDSREISLAAVNGPDVGFDAIITSPPYPTEHDYTRNSRLELAYLGAVVDKATLRTVKRRMIRSHTKGIYREDNDEEGVESNACIQQIAEQISKKAQSKSYGFARLYPKVLKEYFGGMLRHFNSAFQVLRPGGHCAYVVGDQASYFQVPIKTADLLATLAQEAGFKIVAIRKWRERISTSSRTYLDENVLILSKSA